MNFLPRICRSAICASAIVALTFLFLMASSSNAIAQTFIDRQTPTAFRVVSYNMNWDDLFNNPVTAPDELERMINALDADVYCFQECLITTANDARNMFDLLAPLPGGASWKAHKARNQIIISRDDQSNQDNDVPNGNRGIAMAQIDMPDSVFDNDVYILNNHFPCCENESGRVHESEVIMDWMNDARTVGGMVDLDPGTAIIVLGDLNAVDGSTPIDILLDGYGGLTSDWDDTSSSDSAPAHNVTEPFFWTWRNDQSSFDPGVLDFILFTDSVLKMDYSFVLNPSLMSSADLVTSGLMATDFMLDKDNPQDGVFDHMPVVVDFVPVNFLPPMAGKYLDGVVASGALSDVFASDDQYLYVDTSPTKNPVKQKIDLIVLAESNIGTADSFSFRVEANINGGPQGDVQQTISVFNYVTNSFEVLDVRAVDTDDEFVQVPVDGNPDDYQHPANGEVVAKITWETPSFSGAAFFWDLEIDQIGWVIDGTNPSARKGSPSRNPGKPMGSKKSRPNGR